MTRTGFERLLGDVDDGPVPRHTGVDAALDGLLRPYDHAGAPDFALVDAAIAPHLGE